LKRHSATIYWLTRVGETTYILYTEKVLAASPSYMLRRPSSVKLGTRLEWAGVIWTTIIYKSLKCRVWKNIRKRRAALTGAGKMRLGTSRRNNGNPICYGLENKSQDTRQAIGIYSYQCSMAAISANNSSRISLIGKFDAIRSIEIHNRKVSSQTTTDIRTSVEEGRTQMLQRMYKLSESYLTRK
jgi:hypothetical protein